MFGVRCPRHCVPGYDHAVPPGHLPVALTPPYAHGTAPVLRSDRTLHLPDGNSSSMGSRSSCWVTIVYPRRSFDPQEFRNRLLLGRHFDSNQLEFEWIFFSV